MLTIGFVLLAMGLFYASRLTAYRESWLRDRLMVAHSAMMLFGGRATRALPPELAAKILDSVGAKSIVVALPDGRRLIAAPGGAASAAAETVEIGDPSIIEASQSAFRTLFAKPGSLARVIGKSQADGATIDVILDETPLIEAMWRISRNFLARCR